MRAVGIVAEYNPFHNGHLYHVKQAKLMTKADFVVVVMSGNYVQRGAPSVFSKWARTQMALAGGVDLVIELPFVFAVQSAEQFAAGAVRLLNATGVVTHLCFGSEAGSISPFETLSKVTMEETDEFKNILHQKLKLGLPYPAAFAQTITLCCNAVDVDEGFLEEPNNILGIEYCNAIQKYAPKIVPLTIKRLGLGYHSLSVDKFSSASAIRYRIFNHDQQIEKLVPEYVLRIVEQQSTTGKGPVDSNRLSLPVLSYLRLTSPEILKNFYLVNEGLENRLVEAASQAETYHELISLLKTKRYTWARLQRTVLYCLLSLQAEHAKRFAECGPQYLRILGMSERGKCLLRDMQAKADLPIVHRPAKFLPSSIFYKQDKLSVLQWMLRYDIIAGNLYSLCYENTCQAGEDYRQSPVCLV